MTQPFTAQHEDFKRSTRQWVEKELKPHALKWDEDESFPKEVFKKAGDMGFLGIHHNPQCGGLGLDYWYTVLFVEELSRCDNAGVALSLMAHCEIATPIINDLGSDEQKELFLKPSISGDAIAALGISEPNCGSDVANIQTTARADGDDYVINGSKAWITNGTRADFITLAVRTGEAGYKGISLLSFPTDVAGFSVASKLKKVGNMSSDTATLYFDNCRVPRRYLLGQENFGFYHIMHNFQGERLVAAINAAETMAYMLEQTVAYTKERRAFGRALYDFQVTRHKVIDNLAKAAAAKALAYQAVSLFDAFLKGQRSEMPVKEISMAKLFCCDEAQKVAYDCQQLFGGMGYVSETPVARAWRDVRLLSIGGGASEIMKEIISKWDS